MNTRATFVLRGRRLSDWGWILLAEGRCTDAAGVLRMGVMMHPDSAPLLDALAEASLMLGDRGRAITLWERSSALAPARKFAAMRLEAVRDRQGPGPENAICGGSR